VITEEEIKTSLRIIEESVKELPNLKGKAEEKVIPPLERNVTINIDA
jgi:ornithine--oxo-acid transaminase